MGKAGRLLVALGSLAAVVVSAPATAACEPERVTVEVLEADTGRYRATIDQDVSTLATFLGDDLVYTHSTSAVDSKASYLESIRSGRVMYRRTDRSDLKVSAYGCVGVVTGRGDFKVTIEGKDMDVQLRFTNVWVKRDAGWQMVAWESTRIPPK